MSYGYPGGLAPGGGLAAGGGLGGALNLLATFQQNQSKILSNALLAAGGHVNMANFALPAMGLAASSLPYPAAYVPPMAAHAMVQAQTAAAASFAPQARPAAATVLMANQAAKAKSQPRPTANVAAQARPVVQATMNNITPPPTNADYAAAVLGSAIVQPSITPASASSRPAIYTAPPRPTAAGGAPASNATASAASPTSPTGSPAAPSSSGPATTVVKSATNANVSITKAPPPTYDALKCEECGPSAEVIIDPHQGVEVCTSCGLILGNWISDESEWRTFSDRRGDDPNRVGGPEIGLLADAGLATMMGDSPNGLGSTLAKLQNKSALSSNHRALLDAFRKSSRISSLLSLPQSITDRANELYKRILESKTLRPRGADTLIVTCLFMVCKAERVPRTIKEMCGVSEVAQKDLGKCFKEIKRLGFHKTLTSSVRSSSAAAGSDADEDADEYRSYVARWGNQLRMAPKFVEAAKTIAEKARDVLHTARDPGSTCGAALFIASQFGTIDERKMITTISAVVSMSVNTIRAVVLSILENRASILPPEYITAHIEV